MTGRTEAGREAAEEEIRTRLHEINEAWVGGRFAQLARYFDPEIVMVAPDSGGRIAGAEACLASFKEFLGAANVLEFRESEFTADVWGTAAVGTFRFDITYVLDGSQHTEAGREIWLFTRGDDGWRAVWRTQFPLG